MASVAHVHAQSLETELETSSREANSLFNRVTTNARGLFNRISTPFTSFRGLSTVATPVILANLVPTAAGQAFDVKVTGINGYNIVDNLKQDNTITALIDLLTKLVLADKATLDNPLCFDSEFPSLSPHRVCNGSESLPQYRNTTIREILLNDIFGINNSTTPLGALSNTIVSAHSALFGGSDGFAQAKAVAEAFLMESNIKGTAAETLGQKLLSLLQNLESAPDPRTATYQSQLIQVKSALRSFSATCQEALDAFICQDYQSALQANFDLGRGVTVTGAETLGNANQLTADGKILLRQAIKLSSDLQSLLDNPYFNVFAITGIIAAVVLITGWIYTGSLRWFIPVLTKKALEGGAHFLKEERNCRELSNSIATLLRKTLLGHEDDSTNLAEALDYAVNKLTRSAIDAAIGKQRPHHVDATIVHVAGQPHLPLQTLATASTDPTPLEEIARQLIETITKTVADLSLKKGDETGRNPIKEVISSTLEITLEQLTQDKTKNQLTAIAKFLTKAATEQVIETASQEIWQRVLANTVTTERQEQLKAGVILSAVKDKGDDNKKQQVRDIQKQAGFAIFQDQATTEKQKAITHLELSMARSLLDEMSKNDSTKAQRTAIQKTELKKFWPSLDQTEKASWSAPDLVAHCMKTDTCHDTVRQCFRKAFGNDAEITCRDGKTKIKLETLTTDYIKNTLWDVLTDADKIKLRTALMNHYLSENNIELLPADVIAAMEMSIPMVLTERYELQCLQNQTVQQKLIEAKKLASDEHISVFESCLSGPQREAYAAQMKQPLADLYQALDQQNPLKTIIDNRLTTVRNGAVFSALAGFLATGIIQGAATHFADMAKQSIQGRNTSGAMKFIQNLLLGDGETKVPFWIDLIAYWIKLGGAEIGKNIADHGTSHMVGGAADVMNQGKSMWSSFKEAFGW